MAAAWSVFCAATSSPRVGLAVRSVAAAATAAARRAAAAGSVRPAAAAAAEIWSAMACDRAQAKC